MNDQSEVNELEWPGLKKMREQQMQIAVPSDIDARIREGMRLGRQRRRRRMVTRMASYAACMLLLAMVASVRFSPAVAAYVGDIPGLRSLVNLIHYDKGLRLALENDFMQPVGLSEQKNGVKLTVDGILADDSRVIVFYTMDNMDGKQGFVSVKNVKLTEDEETSISFGTGGYEEQWESKQGTIDFNFQGNTGIPNVLNVEFELGIETASSSSTEKWQFAIPVDKSKFEGLKQTYEINETVTVDNQRITFGTMTVYPTRIGLEVEYDPANKKKIFYFDDLRLEDEKGEVFGTITNGMSGSLINDNRHILYFQSNYFSKPEQLYLRASTIRALDKSKLEVKIDLEREALLSSPDDRLTLKDAGTGSSRMLAFGLNNDDPLDEHRQYGIFDNTYADATGRSFFSNRSGSTTDEIHYYLDQGEYQSPLTLYVNDYPTRIRGDINVRIK
ncbi:DUF4179 domain-containing protein [Cohnella sp. GCM10027633]|uniref:DUF4179 domain-containing protein n=1 Tax=unclassified Cohnella TaxID=2636738 RepID=UPI00362D9399